MNKQTLANAIAQVRETADGIEGAEINICEVGICFMCDHVDGEFHLDGAKDLARLTKAIKVITEYK